MLFSSQVFVLLFLPAVLAVFYLTADAHRRLLLLTLASFVFYGWWDPRFVPLLVGSIAGNWWLARRYGAGRWRWALVAGVAFNLALLGWFKYADFFAANLLALAGRAREPFDLVLPLGISFFTFQQISYLVDLRRGKAPVYSLTHYAAYVSFFPQLIAGPIVRHDELIPQLGADPRRAGLHERLSRGALLFVLGLVKKVLLANELAPLVDERFAAAAAGEALGAGDAWYAAGAYTLQLYFDFSAYSDMAIGLGLLFGFRLPLNFDNPYRALDIREFWRSWHITLSRFLRDYVYIPLGGSRQPEARVALAVMITMFLGGLWHGAGWTFVVWGLAHGAAIIASRGWQRAGVPLPAPLAWALTLAFVMAGWVLFRAEDFGVAYAMFRSMAGAGGAPATVEDAELALLVFGAVLALAGPTAVQIAESAWLPRRAVAVAAGLTLVVVTLRAGYGRSIEFIYFQF